MTRASESGIPTSLRRAPSGMTAEQIQARMDAYLGELWHRCGGFYVRQDDYQIPGEIRMACEAIATVRYGKRRAGK